MGILKVTLFGGIRVTHSDSQTEITITRESQALLAYLLVQRQRTHSREVLADLFWGEHSQEKARGSLNTALWKLKKALEPEGVPAGTYLKCTPLGGVGFNKESRYWLDVEAFEYEISSILPCPFQTVEEFHIVNLVKVLELYSGDLLEGLYKDWALRERERLRSLYLKSLIYLMHYYDFRGGSETAIDYGHQILSLDPLREEIHREMMRLYLRTGQRALALRQYEICRLALAEEFGVAPMEDTQALYMRISTTKHAPSLAEGAKEQMAVEQALGQLREANQSIEVAKEQIQQALQVIAQFSQHL